MSTLWSEIACMTGRRVVGWFCCALLACADVCFGAGVRIKDVTEVEGVRGNAIYNVGLVVGLDRTGGTSVATRQMAVEMLRKLNFNVNASERFTEFKPENTSMVMVTAVLPAFAREGSRIDVRVSALDDATSLQGGILLMTPLMGADGEVYATAEGPISIGGFSFSGQAASAQKNHPTVGRVPAGGIIEKTLPVTIVVNGALRFLLHDADPVTCQAIAEAVNQVIPNGARALDFGTVEVAVPPPYRGREVQLISQIGLLEITPDRPARVVINERTGTVVVGGNVRIEKVAITHGSLTIVQAETPQVSQPAPLSGGQTTVVPRSTVEVSEDEAHVHVVESATVADLAQALNALGVTPRDLIAIFQTLHSEGALHAQVIPQ